MFKSVNAVYRVDWTEYERGWGQRPDGSSLHPNIEEAKKAIKEHWDREKERNPSGRTPDWYVKPGKPYMVEVDAVTYRKVVSEGTVWV